MSYGQSIETITEKVSNRICECINNDMKHYTEIKPEFNRCYDKEFNDIFSIVDSKEQKILLEDEALEKIKNNIIPTLNLNCEKIKVLIKSELINSVKNTENSNFKPCPTNFTGDNLKNIKRLNGEIISFNGLITQVTTAHKDKPYYEVKLEGGNTIWIASLIKSNYEVKDNIVRILGYVSKVENDEIVEKYNKTGYHILAFCIVDMNSKQIVLLPGSELQVKEWIEGKIPLSKK